MPTTRFTNNLAYAPQVTIIAAITAVMANTTSGGCVASALSEVRAPPRSPRPSSSVPCIALASGPACAQLSTWLPILATVCFLMTCMM